MVTRTGRAPATRAARSSLAHAELLVRRVLSTICLAPSVRGMSTKSTSRTVVCSLRPNASHRVGLPSGSPPAVISPASISYREDRHRQKVRLGEPARDQRRGERTDASAGIDQPPLFAAGNGAIEATMAEARGVKDRAHLRARLRVERRATSAERRNSTLARNSSMERTPTVCQPDRPMLDARRDCLCGWRTEPCSHTPLQTPKRPARPTDLARAHRCSARRRPRTPKDGPNDPGTLHASATPPGEITGCCREAAIHSKPLGCRVLRCRRRDSNPRHADYDSAALTS